MHNIRNTPILVTGIREEVQTFTMRTLCLNDPLKFWRILSKLSQFDHGVIPCEMETPERPLGRNPGEADWNNYKINRNSNSLHTQIKKILSGFGK